MDAVALLTDSATDFDIRISGWCVYASTIENGPETEIICGGLNDKVPDAAAIFRQGNLLHLGFHPAPTNSNDFAHGLLINSIQYIAKYSDDRPIGRIPSIWANEVSFPRRSNLERYKHESIPEDEAAREAWIKENRGKLVPNEDNELVPDENLQKLGVDSDSDQFFKVAIAALSTDLKAEALDALTRYAPDGPGKKGTADAWVSYWKENGPYLFFLEESGYRWELDPLAKSRQIPTAKLRGSARADKKSGKNPAAKAKDLDVKLDLKILFVGDPDTDRSKAFVSFLGKYATEVTTAPMDGSAIKLAKDVDVVVLDWPNGMDRKDINPIGERNNWNKPTVLIGHAGLRLSTSWRLYGGFG